MYTKYVCSALCFHFPGFTNGKTVSLTLVLNSHVFNFLPNTFLLGPKKTAQDNKEVCSIQSTCS